MRDVIFEAPDYLIRRDDYYQVNRAYLEWCDVLAFESLFERATRATPEAALPLQLELIALYRGEFLAGFELGEWGTDYRASCEARFLQVVKLASEQLLKAGSPQETLAVINKGLSAGSVSGRFTPRRLERLCPIGFIRSSGGALR